MAAVMSRHIFIIRTNRVSAQILFWHFLHLLSVKKTKIPCVRVLVQNTSKDPLINTNKERVVVTSQGCHQMTSQMITVVTVTHAIVTFDSGGL